MDLMKKWEETKIKILNSQKKTPEIDVDINFSNKNKAEIIDFINKKYS